MRLSIFTGVGTAIITPFLDGAVNRPALKRLLDRQLEGGADAIIVCGTTGESATMREAERLQVIECCVEHIDGKIPVIAGTGSNSTSQAVAFSKTVARMGVDGLLVVTPFYNKASQTGLMRHFRAVADAAAVPLILYNVPSRTGVNIQPETYAALAEHPNINGVKEACGNLSQIQLTRNLCPADFSIWSGNDEDTAAICLLGGCGVISVLSNLLPHAMHELTAACLSHDYKAAGAMQLKLKKLCDAMFCEVNPIPVKTALNLMGLEAGELRLPLCEPSALHLEQIRQTLAEYGLLALS